MLRIFYDRYRGWKIYSCGKDVTDKYLKLLEKLNSFQDSKINIHEENEVFLVIIQTKWQHIIEICSSKDEAVGMILTFIVIDNKLSQIFNYDLFSSPGSVNNGVVEWTWVKEGYYISISSKM